MRVLLVDDQPWLRSAIRLLLDHEPGVEVVGELGSVELLPTSLAHFHPDIILLDWEIAGMKSLQSRRKLLNALRISAPNVYIIALSNSAVRHGHGTVGAADAFVSRADPPEQLLAAVQQATRHTADGRQLPRH